MRPLKIKLLLASMALGAMAVTAQAVEPLPEPIITRKTTFSIPYQIDQPADPHAEPVKVQLHVSRNGGLNWQLHATAAPGDEAFCFQAEQDGQYWFTVRTLDSAGVLRPEGPLQPEMRVVVDTLPPVLELHAERLGTGEIRASWKLDDPQLAAESLVVDYQVFGNKGLWQLASTEPPQRLSSAAGQEATGEVLLRPTDPTVPIVVRAEVRDTAGNVAVKRVDVAAGPLPPGLVGETADRATTESTVAEQDRRAPRDVMPGVRPLMVNTLDFELDYDVSSVGAAGVGQVEIWGTRDRGETWVQLGLDEDKQSPCPVTVEQDGIYGFAIVVQSAAGLSGEPPRRGQAPDVWVGVDTVKPAARLTTAEPGQDERGDLLTVSWQAYDSLLGNRPVSLFYSASAEGPWTLIAEGLEDTERHDCRLDNRAPDNIYLKLEVRDVAGNVGEFSTTQAIPLSRPVNLGLGAVVGASGNSPRPKYYHVLR